MSDTATIEAPEITPEASPAPAASKGHDFFMADIERAAATPEKPAAPVAPETPKPEVKKVSEKPPTSPTPDVKPGEPAKPGKEDAGSLRRRVEEQNKLEKLRLSEIETLKKQNQELSSKKIVTPEMESAMEAKEKRIAELNQQISEAAYERSDDFKKQFKDPWEATYNSTVKAVTQMPIVTEDGESPRRATEADFMRVAGAPISERAAIAQQLFGPNAVTILNRIDRMETIKEQSDIAIKQHREGWEAKQKESEAHREGQQKAYLQQRDTVRHELSTRYPDFFGEDANDPEMSEAYKKGVEFVDSAVENAENMSMEELAARSEVARARAAWFPRGNLKIKRLETENASLKEQLAKYRGADPGAELKGDGRGEKPKATDDLPLGTEGLAERMQRIATAQT